ncbi:MAG: DNA polymerase I [Clostridia bacterium]|nr:DNA polymerase I [Clostridia bacterium]
MKMNIKFLQMEGQEADDLIGTVKRISEENGFSVTVLTGDRDMIQLASDKTTVKIPTTSQGKNIVNEYTETSLETDMAISAEQYISVKALMGDKSDNIPGVAGIGEKTALKLISEYKTLDNLYLNIEEIKSENLKNKLLTDKDNAYLSYELSKINQFSPIDISLDQFKKASYDKMELFDLFQKLEFNYFIKKYDLKPVSSFEKILFNLIDVDQIEDIEVKNDIFIYFKDDVLTFTFDGSTVYKLSDLDLIKPLFGNVKKISGHYLKNFFLYLFRHHIPIPEVSCDTATIAYLLDATKDYYDLDEIFNKYSDFQVDLPFSEPVKIFHLNKILLEKINEENMNQLLNEIEHPLIEVLAYLEYIGFKADADFLMKFSLKLQDDMSSLEKNIFLLAGCEFNINSPKQLGKVLFEELKLPHGKKNKTGYSTSIEILEKLSIDFEIAQHLINYRQLTKLKSTYADGLLTKISSEDGRIHSSFNQTVAATGRISSTEPNLQNIPIRSELGREIRKAFICDSDFLLISADYSQIELRILADLSEDEILIDAFLNDEDIHTKTAAKVFGVDERMVTKDMRRAAKAVNFGIIYGISDYGLSRDLKIPVSTARLYIEQYFKEYKKVKRYMDNIIEFAMNNGYVTTIFNRKRFIKELESSNYMQREFGKRIALNTPIQGSSADIIKLAMNKIYYILKERNLKSRLILQIHDELIIEAHKDEIELVQVLLTECMKDPFKLKVPLDIEISSGQTLFET